MCRFLAYIGTPIVLNELLYEPDNSLIKQSYDAKESKEPLNGDGFGVGWYQPHVHDEPALFTAITPAWNNQNLKHISPKILTSSVLAHIRAATVGQVSQANCHPFQYKKFLMMHNGNIAEFGKIKREIVSGLSDEFYQWIDGQTDSEHIFALFLDTYNKKYSEAGIQGIANALDDTIKQVEEIKVNAGLTQSSFLNLVVGDGDCIVAVRYATMPEDHPRSLYYSSGRKYVCEKGVCRMLETSKENEAVLLVSEKLTDQEQDWVKVLENHIVIIDHGLHVSVQALA